MIPMALSGDMSYNKDSLRKGTFDTSYITGISSINFEAIAKERIYKAIDDVKLDSMKSIKDAYAKWKQLRKTAHSHNPVYDAKGNAEVLLHMKNEMELKINLK